MLVSQKKILKRKENLLCRTSEPQEQVIIYVRNSVFHFVRTVIAELFMNGHSLDTLLDSPSVPEILITPKRKRDALVHYIFIS